MTAQQTAAGNFVKGIGGRGALVEAWRRLSPDLQRCGINIPQVFKDAGK